MTGYRKLGTDHGLGTGQHMDQQKLGLVPIIGVILLKQSSKKVATSNMAGKSPSLVRDGSLINS